jgi:hypothetical protein
VLTLGETDAGAVAINGTPYTLAVLCDRGQVTGYRLEKPDGTTYDVSREPWPSCDCGDFQFRRWQKDPAGCKHIKALRALGLLPPRPAPVRLPTDLEADFA